MKCIRSLALIGLMLVVGCGEKPSGTPPQEPAPTAASAPPATPGAKHDATNATSPEADMATILDALTQSLRKFSAEKQRVPKSLQELVAAGYLPALPTAPAGKQFVINEKRVEVILADN
jgi:hypothetical protein